MVYTSYHTYYTVVHYYTAILLTALTALTALDRRVVMSRAYLLRCSPESLWPEVEGGMIHIINLFLNIGPAIWSLWTGSGT